ncbi:3-oxoacyl-[acyl-carrier-protein] synthase, mitochondrial [Trichogramma pretiosum]|uniref:3-oxoacyl-[acyl-carrier-protein] synthase, mitochondrial n=1 Tax=Trichogramma pretiosum TaxID=7493 RepID=UPI0006C93C5F|nr:3-oxoacyl-[acyl-carrier-protein] synthase, mitochondrial [Trichogramma pretiosum]XP_023317558.1 3-oxoacyl-[acyl-carrier-protein] synthase, mitochondrial [Trichogramma pretiosum]
MCISPKEEVIAKCHAMFCHSLNSFRSNQRRISSKCINRTKKDRRVVVTGMGVVSPLGIGVQNAWNQLLNGACGIVELKSPDYEKLPCRIAALVPQGNELLKSKFSTSELRTMCPATAYALIATEEALIDANWKPKNEEDKRDTGVTVGMGMVDLVDVCNMHEQLKKGYSKVSPFFVPRILPNMAAGHISIKYGFQGPNHSVSTACATGAHAIGDAFGFIQSGAANVIVCGGAEACISPLSIAAFCRLRALSTIKNNLPLEASRPFDKARDGFVMGEGAAILILEELTHALNRNAHIYAEILGYGLSGDAAHLTAPCEDGTGALLAMDRALKDAQIDKDEITYVNAHATSTPLGDKIELQAIQSLFGKCSKNITVSSTKGAHGHLLGASGNLESVFTILALKNGIIPPTINLNNVDGNTDLQFVPNVKQSWSTLSRRIALKNAFGFGGTNASLCLAEFK